MKKSTTLAASLFAGTALLAGGCAMFGPQGEDKVHAEALTASIDGYADWPAPSGFEGWQESFEHDTPVVQYHLNAVAAADSEGLPNGSIIVKSGYSKGHSFRMNTIMQKIDGYDPEHGDWYWAMANESGSISQGGQMGACIRCHSSADGDDYTFIND